MPILSLYGSIWQYAALLLARYTKLGACRSVIGYTWTTPYNNIRISGWDHIAAGEDYQYPDFLPHIRYGHSRCDLRSRWYAH